MTKPLWKVALEGEREDLLALSRSFTEAACRVEGGPNRFYLTSSRFDADPESFGPGPPKGPSPMDMRPMLAADAVRKTAVEILTLINGSAYLQFVPYKAVRLGAVYGFYRERAPFITVEYSSGGTRLAWTREFPNESPNPRKWMELAYSNGDVAEALDIFGIQPESQRERRRNLYSIFEIIRKDVGTEKLIAKRGWASLHEIEECRRYLNLARHARPIGSPPSKQMRLWEAESVVRRLLQSWIEEKRNSIASL